MKTYNYTLPPIVENIEPLTADECHALTREYLSDYLAPGYELELHFHISFVSVHLYRGQVRETGEETSGWIIGGRACFLEVATETLTTPIEALAAYCFIFEEWAAHRGNDDGDPDKATFLIPGTWERLKFHAMHDHKMGAITGWLEWIVISDNTGHLIDPYMRERVKQRGWVPRDKGHPLPLEPPATEQK